jgi:hypothetical protein
VNPTVIGSIVFACAFGGALLGMRLRTSLPEGHLGDESKDTVKVGIGLIATMTALVLGLVTASAKSSFDDLNQAFRRTAAELLSFDRTLARYGPETAPMRESLRRVVSERIEETWPSDPSRPAHIDPSTAGTEVETMAARIRALEPQTPEQRWLQSRAATLSEALLDARWTILVSIGTAIPVPFLVVLVFWLTITFASFGLFAPRNATVVVVLLLCALSVAAAVFLILELDEPFDGLIRASPRPLRYALDHLHL